MLIFLLSGRSCLIAADRRPTLIDLDLATGTVFADGPKDAEPAAPGSTLKPFVLLSALRLGVITPHTHVACSGALHLAGRNLTCAHPSSLGVLDAQEALAYSCNTYFARIAKELPSPALLAGLDDFGIRPEHSASSPEQRVLLALGVDDVAVTPLQLAHAYEQLAHTLQQPNPQSETIRKGLIDSVVYGMAHASQTPGVVLGGKTGTAHDSATMLQHGWFAGIVFTKLPETKPTHVVIVFAPGGSGNDAALIAHTYLQSKQWP